MKKFFIIISICFFINGCAASINQSVIGDRSPYKSLDSNKRILLKMDGSELSRKSEDWAHFCAEWQTVIKDISTERGLNITFYDKEIPQQTDKGVLINIYINDYHYITQAARYSVGVMTGNAFIDMKVDLIELPMNNHVVTKKYDTSSSGGEGIFSAMTVKQIYAILNGIIDDLK